MIGVIFEVLPNTGRRDDYFAIAQGLRPELDDLRGFISIERFQSLSDPNKVLSLSFFEDEAAVQRWRELSSHRSAQLSGRSSVFSDYRLRVAHVLRDYGMNEREQAPKDSRMVHD